MLDLYRNLPLHIDPVAFAVGSFEVGWYAISYVVGFAVVYWLLIFRAERGEYAERQNVKTSERQNGGLQTMNYELRTIIIDFLLVGFFSALIGGRVGYVLFYNFSYFLNNPLAIISPFENGEYVGLYGMSYHGGLLGIIIGTWIFLKLKKIPFLEWADFVVPAIPLGYFFGRIGNFLNGELYGRVTTSPFGMYFASDPQNLRYPSQLLETILEGLLLFAILWSIRNKKLPAGTMLAIYFIGYGFFRIISEFFREPDPQIGLLFSYFTMGQILSCGMIAFGILLFYKNKRNGII